MADTTLTIQHDDPIGVIAPRLYGQFAEHLGRCCYDGLWVGTRQREIPHDHGFRRDVLDALRRMPVPLLRWPGGCYADHYHWRDGIGPAEERPRRLGMSCDLQVEDDNSLGTHEFLWLCAQLGAEPYLAGNVGTGSPQELCDWLEYCNSARDTALTRMRRANGQAAPFSVPLWGVGNENWGCGGNFDPASYAREYRRYATMLRHVDPRAELVACGSDGTDREGQWNRTLLQTIRDHLYLVDHLSIHSYWKSGGSEINFSADDYYHLLREASSTEAFVRQTAEIIAAEAGGRRIGIALDEWGVWHPEVRSWGPGDVPRRTDPLSYEQAGTLRDALAAAVAFEGFHRQCHVLTMANIAQIVNILHAPVMTDGAAMWLTPTYYAFQMHAPHIGATALPVAVGHGDALPDGSGAVSATASRSESSVALSLINRHYDREKSVRIDRIGSGGNARGHLLTADDPRAQNSAHQPDRVVPVPLKAQRDGDGWRIDLPPHALATLVFSG